MIKAVEDATTVTVIGVGGLVFPLPPTGEEFPLRVVVGPAGAINVVVDGGTTTTTGCVVTVVVVGPGGGLIAEVDVVPLGLVSCLCYEIYHSYHGNSLDDGSIA